MGSPETTAIQSRSVDRGYHCSSDLTNIKVPKKVADLVRVYCIFNGLKVTEFVTEVLSEELKGFKEKVEKMK